MKKQAAIFSLLTVTFFTSSALARCQSVAHGSPGGDASGGVPLIFGYIKLMPEDFMPPGLIGVTHVTVGQAQAFQSRQGQDTLLYTCDLTDAGKTYEAFATNGDSNVGGYRGNGDNVYQTYFPFIGIKLIRDSDGQVFSRYWKRAPISGHVEGNKLNFYASDFSGVTAEVYRLSSTMKDGQSRNNFGCSEPAPDSSYGIRYTCTQPNGYTVFVGPGWNDKANITPGADSNDSYSGFTYTDWIGFGMQYSSANMLTMTQSGCRVYDYTKTVTLPPVTVAALKAGSEAGRTFYITYRCGGPAIKDMIKSLTGQGGPGTDTISVAFKTTNLPPGGFASPYWTPYLISDNYGQDGYATNVGINIDIPGVQNMLGFITGDVPWDSGTTTMRGWVSPLSGEVSRQTPGTNILDVTSQYFASYAVINPAEPVTPGKVDATAYIVVKYW